MYRLFRLRHRAIFDTCAAARQRMCYNQSMPRNNGPSKSFSKRSAEIARAVGLSAALIGVGSLAAVGCAGDQGQGQTGASPAGSVATTGGQSGGVIFGDECYARDDIYQEGLLHIADGRGGIDLQRFNDLANYVTIKDGRSGVKAPKITSIPEDILDQIRTSVTLSMDQGLLAPVVVNLYGERQSDWDDYDGVLNSGLKACV